MSYNHYNKSFVVGYTLQKEASILDKIYSVPLSTNAVVDRLSALTSMPYHKYVTSKLNPAYADLRNMSITKSFLPLLKSPLNIRGAENIKSLKSKARIGKNALIGTLLLAALGKAYNWYSSKQEDNNSTI